MRLAGTAVSGFRSSDADERALPDTANGGTAVIGFDAGRLKISKGAFDDSSFLHDVVRGRVLCVSFGSEGKDVSVKVEMTRRSGGLSRTKTDAQWIPPTV